jgi:C-lobe and N-lobe beta barrels of Tf-binding protein B
MQACKIAGVRGVKEILSAGILALSTAFLSGCGGGGGSSAVIPVAAANTNPSIVDPLTDGAKVGETLNKYTPLTASQFNATRITYDAKTGKSVQARPGATILKNIRGGYDVTIAGKTTSFGTSDQKGAPDAWEQAQKDPSGNGTIYSMALWNAGKGNRAGIETEENGQTFHKILGYYVFDNTGTGTRERGHFIVGNATDPLRMALKNRTATYNGYFYTNVSPTGGPPPDQAMAVTGGLRMVADFDANTIQGQSTTFAVRQAGASDFVPASFTLQLQPATINGNSFSGQMTSGYMFMNGAYTGQFYGGNAQETAGVLTGTNAPGLTEGFFTAVAEPAAP